MAIKPEGGGGVKALMARPLREELFFAASLTLKDKSHPVEELEGRISAAITGRFKVVILHTFE